MRDALYRLDPLWEELFPAEQARIVQALVERVTVGPAGADIRLRVAGLAGLVPLTADPALVKALARAFRWKRMLDGGQYGSVRELARGERVKLSYAAGTPRLTLLMPALIEAIWMGLSRRG